MVADICKIQEKGGIDNWKHTKTSPMDKGCTAKVED